MSAYYGVHLDDPSTTTALDTSMKPSYGGAARPGETRWHLHPTYGWQRYRYVLNDVTSALTAYLGYQWTAPTTSGFPSVTVGVVTVESMGLAMVAGIPQNAIADDYFGWVQIGGIGLVTSSAAAAAGAVCDSDASGKFDDDGTGALVGVWMELASGADENKRVFLSIPG